MWMGGLPLFLVVLGVLAGGLKKGEEGIGILFSRCTLIKAPGGAD